MSRSLHRELKTGGFRRQSILADAFPPAKRGQGFALFGIAVVVAPVVGPTLGGYLADNYSWHWCFLRKFKNRL